MKEKWSTAMYILRYRHERCKITGELIFKDWIAWAKKIIKLTTKLIHDQAKKFQKAYKGSYSIYLKLAWKMVEQHLNNYVKYGKRFIKKVGGVVYLKQKTVRHKATLLSNKILNSKGIKKIGIEQMHQLILDTL